MSNGVNETAVLCNRVSKSVESNHERVGDAWEISRDSRDTWMGASDRWGVGCFGSLRAWALKFLSLSANSPRTTCAIRPGARPKRQPRASL